MQCAQASVNQNWKNMLRIISLKIGTDKNDNILMKLWWLYGATESDNLKECAEVEITKNQRCGNCLENNLSLNDTCQYRHKKSIAIHRTTRIFNI